MMVSKEEFDKLIDALETVQAVFGTALKEAYTEGFKNGRDEDYLGCDVMARWESSGTKKEIDTNG